MLALHEKVLGKGCMLDSHIRILFLGVKLIGTIVCLATATISFSFGASTRTLFEGEGRVVLSPEEGAVEVGTLVEVEALPAEGWKFERWKPPFISNEPKMLVEVYEETEFEAVFYREIEGAPWGGRSYRDVEWKYTEENGIRTLLLERENDSSSFEYQFGFVFDGPGRFSFQTSSVHAPGIALSGKEHSIARGDFVDGTVYVNVPEGRHTVAVDEFFREGNSVTTMNWEPGYVVDLKVLGKGSVAGAELGESRHLAGSTLSLEAIPDEGFVFEGWLHGGSDPGIDVEVGRNLELVAIFNRTFESQAIEGDELLTRISGDGLWELKDGWWHAPDDTHSFSASRMTGVLVGPARLDFTFGEDSTGNVFLSLGVDGIFEKQISRGSGEDYRNLEIPEGEHSFYIETDFLADGSDPSVSIQFKVMYPLSITALGGEVESSFDLITESYRNPRRYSNWIEKGTQLTLTAKPSEEERDQFAVWEGDLSGDAATLQFTMDGSIEAVARFGVASSFDGSDNMVQATPAGGFFSTSVGRTRSYVFLGEGVGSLTGTVEGPGSIFFNNLFLSLELELYVNGERVSPELSSPFARFGPGEHTIHLDVRSEPQEEAFDIHTLYGVPLLEWRFTKGYPVPIRYDSSKGRVVLTDTPGALLGGEELEVTAVAAEGWEFDDWIGSFAGQPETFTFTFDPEQEIVEPKFKLLPEYAGLVWQFEGGDPLFLHPSTDGGIMLEISADRLEATATTEVEGPGVLEVNFDYDERPGSRRIVVVDGKEFRVQGRELFSLPIGDGTHNLTLKNQKIEDSIYSPSQQYFGLPNIRSEYLVTGTSTWGALDVDLPEGGAVLGATVTFSAPTPVGEIRFLGWYDRETGELLSSEKVFEFVVDRDLDAEALYFGLEITLEGFDVFSDSDVWSLETQQEGGEDVIGLVTKENVEKIYFRAKRAMRLGFIREHGDGVSLQLSKPDTGFSYWIRDNEAFSQARYEVFVDEGETLELSFSGVAPDQDSSLFDIRSYSGWGPSYFMLGNGELEVVETGEVATVSAKASFSDRFLGFGGNDRAPVEYQKGGNQLLEAWFMEDPIKFPELEQFTYNEVMIEGDGLIRSASDGYNVINFETNANGVLAFESLGRPNVYIDGRSVFEVYSLEGAEGKTYFFPIEAGHHTVQIRFTRYTNWLRELRFEKGYMVMPNGFGTDSPFASVSEDGWLFEKGTELEVSSISPGGGRLFIRWNGSLEGEPATTSLIVDRHLFLNPLFSISGLEERFVEVDGGVIVVGSHNQDFVRIDGKSVRDHPLSFRMRESSPDVNVVPIDGSKIVTIWDQGWGSEPFFHVPDGVVGGIYGRGVELSYTRGPNAEYFLKGETVTIHVSGAQMSEVNWDGLPADAVFDGNSVRFVVEDSFFVLASIPIAKLIDGEPVEVEGFKFIFDDYGLELKNYKGPTRGIVRYRSRADGWLDYRLTKPNFLRVNGNPEIAASEGRLLLEEGDLVEFDYGIYSESYRDWQYAQEVRLLDLRYEEVEIGESKFWAWWRRYYGDEADVSELFDLTSDLDHDGFSLLSEYLMDTDPKTPEHFLSMEMNESLGLVYRFPSSIITPDNIELVWSESMEGPWEPIEDLVGAGFDLSSISIENLLSVRNLKNLFIKVKVTSDPGVESVGRLLGIE